MATTTIKDLPNKEERAKIEKKREPFTSICVSDWRKNTGGEYLTINVENGDYDEVRSVETVLSGGGIPAPLKQIKNLT